MASSTMSIPPRSRPKCSCSRLRRGPRKRAASPTPAVAFSGSWKAADPYFEAKTDIEILADLFMRMRKMYEKDGGKGKDPILAVDWSYKDPLASDASKRLLTELNGKALVDLKDAKARSSGPQGSSSPASARCGTTGRPTAACGSTPASTVRRATSPCVATTAIRPVSGVYGNWGFSWPANRRIQYNRASADPEGKPWSEAKKYMYWNGERWTGPDVPDYVPTIPPDRAVGPFIMNPEGVSRLWVRGLMADGPFPVHYEPFESPVGNLLFPKRQGQPGGARVQGRYGGASAMPRTSRSSRPPTVSSSTSTSGPRRSMPTR